MKIFNIIDKLILESTKIDRNRANTYRLLKNEFLKFKTAKNAKPLDDISEINIIKKMIKERKDASIIYRNNNRPELAEEEEFQITILSEFLPEEASESDIKQSIQNWININGELTKKDMGKCIKFVKSELPNSDGKLISKLIQELWD